MTIRGRGGDASVLAVETADQDSLAAFVKQGDAQLLLTHARARTLKIRLYTPRVVGLPLARSVRISEVRNIADPTADLGAPLKGPFEASRDPMPQAFQAGVKLAKLAGLLPAVIARRTSPVAKRAPLPADAVERFDETVARSLQLVTRARVPLEGAENTEIAAFRPAEIGPEHYAIIISAPDTHKPVLTRIHSECFTGDLLHSLKCDCGEQLRGAIETISKSGGGILLYLAQEGRGIGLVNKLRAYRLQDQGFDTLEANERLGFEADERLYAIAARMLTLLGYKSVRLLTNNPDKVSGLKKAGIRVSARVPHKFPGNAHNLGYLETKARRAGHDL